MLSWTDCSDVREAVPVERIRLDKETVTAEETVAGEVGKEKIEILDADCTDIYDTTDGMDRRAT